MNWLVEFLPIVIGLLMLILAGVIGCAITKATDNNTIGLIILGAVFCISVPLMVSSEFKESLYKLINTQETTQTTNTTIDIPAGYKFVTWIDDAKTSYIIEDADGNQQVIIIEKNDK